MWHAKRFKMMEYHGYKIAEQCYDKGARATYRYLHNGCLLYVSPIERLRGYFPYSFIIHELSGGKNV